MDDNCVYTEEKEGILIILVLFYLHQYKAQFRDYLDTYQFLLLELTYYDIVNTISVKGPFLSNLCL